MVVNIYDTANEMERQMRETQEFQALKEAFAELKKDEDAFGTFQKFQEKQMQAQQKQMQGTQLTEEEMLCIRWHMGAFDEKTNWNYYTRAIHKYPNVLWTHMADMVSAHINQI